MLGFVLIYKLSKKLLVLFWNIKKQKQQLLECGNSPKANINWNSFQLYSHTFSKINVYFIFNASLVFEIIFSDCPFIPLHPPKQSNRLAFASGRKHDSSQLTEDSWKSQMNTFCAKIKNNKHCKTENDVLCIRIFSSKVESWNSPLHNSCHISGGFADVFKLKARGGFGFSI